MSWASTSAWIFWSRCSECRYYFPFCIIYCLEKSGCDKSQAVLIGDSKYDAIGAKEAGIDFIAVTYGFGFKTEDDAKEFPCCAVCDDVIQIEKFLCE